MQIMTGLSIWCIKHHSIRIFTIQANISMITVFFRFTNTSTCILIQYKLSYLRCIYDPTQHFFNLLSFWSVSHKWILSCDMHIYLKISWSFQNNLSQDLDLRIFFICVIILWIINKTLPLGCSTKQLWSAGACSSRLLSLSCC